MRVQEIFGPNLEVDFNTMDENDAPSHYNFETDRPAIFVKFFERFKTDVDFKNLFAHVICHECGHAREARNFAENCFYPFMIIISNRASTTVENMPMLVRSLDKSVNVFRSIPNQISDHSIDRLPFKEGLRDPTSVIRVAEAVPPSESTNRAKDKLQLLFDVLTFIHDTEFGMLTPEQKNYVKQSSISWLGEKKWNKLCQLLSGLVFDDVAKYRIILGTAFLELFNLRLSFPSLNRSEVTVSKNFPSLLELMQNMNILQID